MSVSLLLRFLRDRVHAWEKYYGKGRTVQIGFHSNYSDKCNGSTQPREKLVRLKYAQNKHFHEFIFPLSI